MDRQSFACRTGLNVPSASTTWYFANHRGEFIRLAYADAVGGPWKIYEPGVLHVRDTAFYRSQPDRSRFGGNNTHLASPEV